MTSRAEDLMCNLTCRSFFCSKKMLKFEKNSNKKTFICGLDDSECLGSICNYAECRERKLSDSGNCLRSINPPQQKSSKNPKVYSKYESSFLTPNDLDDKLRKKLSKKLKI